MLGMIGCMDGGIDDGKLDGCMDIMFGIMTRWMEDGG